MNAELFELYKDLIRCRAVSADIPAVNKSEKTLLAFLQKNGFYCSEELINGRVVVYASTEPGKVADILLNAHLDVVPAAYEEQFEPRIEGTRMYARGAYDCIGNAMAMIQCMLEARGKYSIGAIFTADEEIGGETTAGMVERGYGARKVALVVDGGYGSITYAQKGIIIMKLTATGTGGHASVPWTLDNPIDRLMDGYIRFRNAWTNPTAENTWGDSMAPCILKAGEAHNAIPDTAEMTINIRYTTDEAYEKIIRMAEELTGVDVSILETCPPVVMDPQAPALQILGKAFEAVDPDLAPIKYSRLMGATDARHLRSLGVPIGIIGATGGGVHGKAEYLELPSIDRLTDILLKYAELLAAE